MQDLRVPAHFQLRGDNTGAIALANNAVFHTCLKHLDVHYDVVQEMLSEKLFSLDYISSTDNLADLFTKGVQKTKH